MYFYTEPEKLKIALQQIEEEFLKLKVDSDMIWTNNVILDYHFVKN